MADSLKKTKVKLGSDQLTNIGMLLMVEKNILSGICHTVYQFVKLITNTMKINYDENKELPCLKYWDVNNFLDEQCLGGCL